MPTAAQPLIDTLSWDMPDLLRQFRVCRKCDLRLTRLYLTFWAAFGSLSALRFGS